MNSFPIDTGFEELKKRWDSIVPEVYTHNDLLKMTQPRYVNRLRKLRMKLVLQTCISALVVLSIFLVARWWGVSYWLAGGMIACNAFYLFNNGLGYYYLSTQPREETVLGTLTQYKARMKKMLNLSFMASSLIVFFVPMAEIWLLNSATEQFVFYMFLAPLTWLSFWSAEHWRKRTAEMSKTLDEFNQ